MGRGKKLYINGPSHMTKMVAMPIFSKKKQPLQIFFSRTGSPMILKLGMQHWRLTLYKIYINNDPELTLINFMARSNLVVYAF